MALTPTTQAFPGANGGYIPTLLGGETAQIIVGWSRDPKKFVINELLTLTSVDRMIGYWARVDFNSFNRVISDPDEAVWADGHVAPAGPHDDTAWNVEQYSCKRRTRQVPMGYQARDQSSFPLKDVATQKIANLLMLHRAVGFYTKALDPNFYLSNHTATATAAGGGYWSSATGSNPYIFNSLMYAANVINQDTAGVVNFTDLTLVLSPAAAYKTAATVEIRDYLAQQPGALDQIRGGKPGVNANWGLPDTLYGMKLRVDPTLQNTGVRKGTASNARLTTDTTAIILNRSGDAPVDMGTIGKGNFSTWHLFSYNKEEMQMEEFDEPVNKRVVYRGTDTWDLKPLAPETGFLLSSIF